MPATRKRSRAASPRLCLALLALAAATLAGAAGARAGATLERVQARGMLACAVTQDLPGFAERDAEGRWRGFDIDFCRAVAVAIAGPEAKIEIMAARADYGFALLQSGEADLLLYGTPQSLGGSAGQGVEQVAPLYYDGQGFAVAGRLPKDIASLDGRRLCVAADGQAGDMASEYLRARGFSFQLVTLASDRAVQREFSAGKCDAVSAGRRVLTILAARAGRSDAQHLLPDLVSKEPLSPTVARGDPAFAQVVRWVRNALLAAEELAVTAGSLGTLERDSEDPAVRRLLGLEGELGKALQLDSAWAARAIGAAGNYGEMFGRHLAPLGLERGLNALRRDGGLMDSPPFL